jgi:DNA-binding transcriptional ArsR family regulator
MVIMDNIEEIAEIFKALSDPTRLRIIKMLNDCSPGICNGGAMCVNALSHKAGVTQSAVSQHLRVLRQAGIVRGERRGPFIHYSINQEGLEKYRSLLRETLGDSFRV